MRLARRVDPRILARLTLRFKRGGPAHSGLQKRDLDRPDLACAVLERHRVRCWTAPRDITPGDEWGAAHQRAQSQQDHGDRRKCGTQPNRAVAFLGLEFRLKPVRTA